MPERRWKHDCCFADSGTIRGRRECPECGAPGEFVGWSRSMIEAMGHYQRIYGVKAVGPHRKLADRLFGPMRQRCSICDGSGFTGDETAWENCWYCATKGGFWIAPPVEILFAWEDVILEFPDAIVPNSVESVREATWDATFAEVVRSGDEFIEHLCVNCSLHAALFTFRGEYVGLCPQCVVERLDDLEEKSGRTMPPDVRFLREEARGSARHQRRERDSPPTVDFDDFIKCARCEKLILLDDARYYFPPGESSSPPYCVECYVALSGRRGPST